MSKENKVKRLVALGMMLVMLCMATACGDSQKETTAAKTEDATKATESAEGTEASTQDETVFKNTDIYPLNSDKTFTVATGKPQAEKNAVVTQVWEEGTGVKVNWVYWTDDQLKLSFSSEELPDATFMCGGMTKDQVYEYGKSGYLINFADYLDKMPNLKKAIEEDPKLISAVANSDGSFYTLPYTQGAPSNPSNLLYYRTDYMEEIGWDAPPATTDEFLQYIKALQAHFGAKDKEFIAFNAYKNTYMNWDGQLIRYFFPAFGELVDPRLTYTKDGKVAVGAATEQYKLTLQFMNEIWESGAFNTNIYTEDGTYSQALNAGGHVGVSGTHTGHTASVFPSGKFEMDIFAPLTSEYWSEQHTHLQSPYRWGNLYMLSSKCEDLDTMLKWFDAMYTTIDNPMNEEGTIWGLSLFYCKISVGEPKEGTHVLIDLEENTYKEMEIPGFEYGKFLADQSFNGSPYPGVGTVVNQFISDPNTGVGVKCMGVINNLWPYAEEKDDLSMLVLTEDESDIYNDAWTDIKAFLAEWTAKFITGEKDIEANWAEYMSNLERMGINDVIRVYQAAYDRTYK